VKAFAVNIMTKTIAIESAKCNYCEKEIASGEKVYAMSIDFSNYLIVGGKDHTSLEEVTGDNLSKDGSIFAYDLCEDCFWSLKEFIQKGLFEAAAKKKITE
jgi:hypothetical protein